MVVVQAAMVAADMVFDDSSEEEEQQQKIDHRTLPRSSRRKWRHDQALMCIMRDYLGPVPLFDGREFDTMFRISKSRFQRLMEDIGNTGNTFFLNNTDAVGNKGASFEARLLLPLKTLAYGVPPHTFSDYFQMSPNFARDCCKEMDNSIKSIYAHEYLRMPTKADIKAILQLHKEAHGIDGMFGSLDCMHTYWKNCPKAWNGSFKGSKGMPSIILEALSDYHMWFWHASYGYAGTFNDLNVLHQSPFMAGLLDGTFNRFESQVVPYQVGKEQFKQVFILTDGIYPQYARFMKAYSQPISPREKAYCGWQEAARKAIERAFGVLQMKFQFMARPILLIDQDAIHNRVHTCLILHNMCVADRVMDGDVRAAYNPANAVARKKRLLWRHLLIYRRYRLPTGCKERIRIRILLVLLASQTLLRLIDWRLQGKWSGVNSPIKRSTKDY